MGQFAGVLENAGLDEKIFEDGARTIHSRRNHL